MITELGETHPIFCATRRLLRCKQESCIGSCPEPVKCIQYLQTLLTDPLSCYPPPSPSSSLGPLFTMAWRLLKLCSGLVRGTKVTLPYTQTHTHTHKRHTHIHTYTQTHTYRHRHTYIHTHNTHTHTYIHRHRHTQTHTHTHTE